MNHRRRVALAWAAAGLALLSLGSVATAHPLGNFTVNHYDGIRVGIDSVLVDHVVDIAEIPTFRERAAMDTDRDTVVGPGESDTYLASACETRRSQIDLRADGAVLTLTTTQRGLSFPIGQGALTTRLVCTFQAALPLRLGATATDFSLRADADADRIGWREIVVQGDGVTLTRSDAPDSGLSARLTAYPTDPLATPATQITASWSAVAGGPLLPPFRVPDARPLGETASASAGAAETAEATAAGITELGADVVALFQARELTWPVILLSMLAAAGLGALHAASPGHGKTVMAAYLVGSRGTSRQALGLGLTVTLSHTLGVLALGALSLYAASFIAPERLYPILGTVSGAIVIAIGTWLVLGRLRIIRRERAESRAHDRAHAAGDAREHHHTHEDAHEHTHPHEAHGDEHEHAVGHGHDHPHADDGYHSHGGIRHTHLPAAGSSLSMRGLFALGLAGGMVPSVSAIILLLGSISLGRPAYGIALTVAFGVGMAVVLVGVGVLLVHARGLLDRIPAHAAGMRLSRALPTATALVVLGAGVVITTQAALAIH